MGPITNIYVLRRLYLADTPVLQDHPSKSTAKSLKHIFFRTLFFLIFYCIFKTFWDFFCEALGRSVGPVWPRGCPPRGCPKTLEKLKEYRTSLFLKSRFCIIVMYFFVTSWTCFGRLWPLFGPLVASRVHQDPQKECIYIDIHIHIYYIYICIPP